MIGVASAALLASNCAFLQDDLRHPGGLFGKYADSVIPGANKHWQVYRGAAAFALVSSTAMFTVQSAPEAKIFWEAMRLVDSDLSRLREISNAPNCKDVRRVLERAVVTSGMESAPESLRCNEHFEAVVPIFEGHLLKLAGYALPPEAYDKVRRAMSSGISVSTVTAVLEVTGSMLTVGHNVAGTYRSETELYANELLLACAENPNAVTLARDVYVATKIIRDHWRDESCMKKIATYIATPEALAGYYDLVQDACLKLRGRSVVDRNGTPSYEIADCRFQFKAAT